jgi:large subunit ribosomal protein L10
LEVLKGGKMTREDKNKLVSYLVDEFKDSAAIVVCDYKGTSHIALEELRKLARENDVKIQVAKNTLASLAIKNAGLEELELNGPSLFVWADDQISACKVADKFATANKDTFSIKTGIVEGKVADIETINALAKLPGREELLGMLLSVWTAPARNFVTGLDNLRAKLEEEAA